VKLVPGSLETGAVHFSLGGDKVFVVAESDHSARMQIYSAEKGQLLTEMGDGVRLGFLVNADRWAACRRYPDPRFPAGELWDLESQKVVQSFHEDFQQSNPDGSVLLFNVPPKWEQTSVWRVRASVSRSENLRH
jgi:hypothetical protein